MLIALCLALSFPDSFPTKTLSLGLLSFRNPVLAQTLVFEQPDRNHVDETDGITEEIEDGMGHSTQANPSAARILNPVLAPFSPSANSLPTSQQGVVFAVPAVSPTPGSFSSIPSYTTSNGQIRLVQSVTPFQASTPPAYAPGSGTLTPATSPGFPNAANPTWDPYATPGGGPLFGSGNGTGTFGKFPDGSRIMRRFIEKVSLDFTYIPRGNATNGFGIDEVAYQTEFTFPSRFLPNNEPIYLVPGLNLEFWDGPDTSGLPFGMSPNGFGAYVEVGAAPRYSENFAFEAWLRGGVYSDWKKIAARAFRLEGRGAVLIGLTKDMEAVLGVVYLNRSRVKMLPQAGIIWKPNTDVVWRLVFPDPKLSRFLTTLGTTQWWGYIQGSYGGGCWAISDNEFGETYLTDYNDIRIGVGLEFTNQAWMNGFVEIGGTFARELYADGVAWSKPPNTIYLKAGFHF